MILGIVSDTHGHLEFTRAAVRMLEGLEVEQVIHCGDIGSEEIVGLFRAWPTHFVFGNVDMDYQALRKAIAKAGQACHDRFGELELAGRRIAFLHSDDAALFQQTVEGGQYDLVCYGHTHRMEQHLHDKTLVVNPGAIYRANPRSIAIAQLPALEVAHIPL